MTEEKVLFVDDDARTLDRLPGIETPGYASVVPSAQEMSCGTDHFFAWSVASFTILLYSNWPPK